MAQAIGRRGLITGLISLVAAPAIVRASSLMPIKVYMEWDLFNRPEFGLAPIKAEGAATYFDQWIAHGCRTVSGFDEWGQPKCEMITEVFNVRR